MVPEGWEKKLLGDLCDFTQGVQIPDRETFSENKLETIRYLYIRDFFTDKFMTFVENKYPSKIMSYNDIMMVNTGNTAGNVYRGKYGVLSNNAFKISIIYTKVLFSDFLWQFLNSPLKERMFKKLFNSAGQPHVGHKNIAQLEILLPPLQEQQKIAKILSTWDEAIEKNEKLIELKKKNKKYLSETLLTGKKRLNEFISENYRIVTLQEIGVKIIDGDRGVEYPKSDDFSPNGFCLFLNTKNVTKDGFKFDDISFISKTKHESLRKGLLQKEDLVITTRGTIGNIAYFDGNIKYEKMRINSGMIILRSENKNISIRFLYCTFKGSFVQNQFNKLSFGSAQPQLTVKIINNIKFHIFPLEEQQKIAQFLTTCDKEIETLENKLQKIKLQKTALMQQLLTKKKRVTLD